MRACVTKPFARDSYWSAHPRSANTRSLFVQDTSYPFHWSIVFPISSILPDMILPYLRHRQMAKNAKSYGPSHQTLTNDAPYNRIYIHTREYRSCCIIRLVYNRTTTRVFRRSDGYQAANECLKIAARYGSGIEWSMRSKDWWAIWSAGQRETGDVITSFFRRRIRRK